MNIDFLTYYLFWIFLVLIVIFYSLMRFILYGWGSRKEEIIGATIFVQIIIIILTFILINWDGSLALIVCLILLSFPIKFIIYLIYKRLLPKAQFMNFSQFRINYQSRKNNEHQNLSNSDLDNIGMEYDNDSEKYLILLKEIKNNPKITSILVKHKKSNYDIESIFSLIKVLGGSNLANTIIQSPDLLEKYLEMKEKGRSDIEVIYNLSRMLGMAP